MQILGTGIDIVENIRIKKSLKNKNFINRIFTTSEILYSKKINDIRVLYHLFNENKRNIYVALTILIILFGCTSTTKKSDSDVDRIQLMLLPEFMAMSMSQSGYIEILDNAKKDGILNTDALQVERVRDISYNLINQTYIFRDDAQDWNWEINVIDSELINAFCMPGGKIAVYTGILDITKNTNGLAAVMGHEIAHAVAKHSVERASRGVLLNTGTQLIDIFSGGKLSQVNRVTGMNTVGLLSQIGIMNPFSRTQESEADYLGMIFSSLSGYDIRETKKLWERMKASKKGKEISEFMSTHPSSDTRIKNLTQWENEVILDYPPIILG